MKQDLKKFPGYKLFEKLDGYLPFANPRPFIKAYLLLNTSIVVVAAFILGNKWFTIAAIVAAIIYNWVYFKALSNWKKYDEMKEKLEEGLNNGGPNEMRVDGE